MRAYTKEPTTIEESPFEFLFTRHERRDAFQEKHNIWLDWIMFHRGANLQAKTSNEKLDSLSNILINISRIYNLRYIIFIS